MQIAQKIYDSFTPNSVEQNAKATSTVNFNTPN